MPTHKKNTLLKAAEGNAATKAFKRVFFSPPKNPPFLFLQIYFAHRTGSVLNRTDSASNVNRFGQSVCGLDTSILWTERRASANSTYKKLAFQFSAETFVVNQTLILRINIWGKNCQLLVAANR